MLPFSVSRDNRASLTEQVTAGLRRSIETGHYREGDTLPTMQETAQSLSVSMAVVRTAIRRLSREGLVTARPRRGIQVCSAGHQRWQAHVLYLHRARASSYYEAVFSETVMHQLLARHILVTPIHITNQEVAGGYPFLNSVIHAGPVDMVALAATEPGIDVFLAENEIPFVQKIGMEREPLLRLARRVLRNEVGPAWEQAVRHAVDCGVRSLMMAVCDGDGGGAKGLAQAAGIAVQVVTMKRIGGLGLPEAVERGGLVGMTRFLEAGGALPDMLYFADDFLAQGALTTLLARGIRVPDDVQVISWANRSLGPVFPKPLTRIEMDPVRDGRALADLVIEALRKPGRKIKEPVAVGPKFIVGETTRRAV